MIWLRIRCQTCSQICGSIQEYNLHCKNLHKQKPLKKEKLRELALVEQMFEFTKCRDEIEFRIMLRENPWLSKFLTSYLFDDSFVFFNKRKMLAGMGLKESEDFKKALLKHIEQKRVEMVGVPMRLESFQYLIYIINKLRKSVRDHYEILLPFCLQLDKKDLSFVIDILEKKFKISKMQLEILKGGI